jgi:hypothetical protein
MGTTPLAPTAIAGSTLRLRLNIEGFSNLSLLNEAGLNEAGWRALARSTAAESC